MPIGGLLGDECASLQMPVNEQTRPGVDGGIPLLGIAELGGFPVGELLSFADLLLEKYGVDLLQAHVGDVVLLDQLLQFNEACGMHVAYACELVKVVGGRKAHLDDTGIFQVFLEWGGDACLVQSKEECVVVDSELQQGDFVPFPTFEARSCFGIKTC